MPRYLVTNDDGVMADGIRHLRQALARQGTVDLVAPEREMSATAHSITVHEPLRAFEVVLPGGNGEKGWAVSGTPTDCVKLGLEALFPEPPDLVVSGVNIGANLGTDVLYSGTVSAAVEGVLLGVPGLAVSLANPGIKWEPVDEYLETAAGFAAFIAKEIIGRGLPSGTLLNVNVPAIPKCSIKGIRITKLGTRRYENVWDRRVDPRGRIYYWMGGDPVDVDDSPDADTTAIREGYVSITPIHFDFTRYDLISSLKEWEMDAACFPGIPV